MSYRELKENLRITFVLLAAFTRFNLSDKLGLINQIDCVVEFSFCLHVSTMLKESVHFKMAQTEVIRVGAVTISEVLSENLHELLKNKIRRKRRWWVKNWVTQRHSLVLRKNCQLQRTKIVLGTVCRLSPPHFIQTSLIFTNSVE